METVKRRSYLAIIGLFVALIAYTGALRSRNAAPPPAPPLESIPEEIGGYAGTSEDIDPQALELLGADATLFRTYRNDAGEAIWLYLAYFGAQRENSQIHSPKHCYPGSGWNIVEESSTDLALASGDVPIKHLLISDGVEEQYVLYWFSGAGGIMSDEFALKWHQMKSSLLGKSQATAFVRFSTAAPPEGKSGARDALARFAERIAPSIENALREAGAAPRASPERTP